MKEIIGTKNGQQYFVGQAQPLQPRGAPVISPTPSAPPPPPMPPKPGTGSAVIPPAPTTASGTDPNSKPSSLAGVSVPPNPVAPAKPADLATTIDQTVNSSIIQTQLKAIKDAFAGELATETTAGAGREQNTRATDVARGLIGSPQAESDVTQTKEYNKKQVQDINTRQELAVSNALSAAQGLAVQIKQNNDTNYQNDYTNWKDQNDKLVSSAKDTFKTLSSSATSATWEDYIKADPEGAKSLLQSSGYSEAMAPFIWNQNRAVAKQIQYDSAPVQLPDGTYMVIGHDPSKTGPESIIRTKIDSAPEGMTTTIVGGLPYWKDNNSGALYQVPSEKGQLITLKDANGTNYMYNTYTKQFINPLGADTSGGGQVSPNAPASPLSPTSTLGQLLGYYVSGNTSYTPGSGYTGAVLNALGPGANLNMTLDQLKAKIPDIAAGIIKAEGSPVLESQYNNGGAIMWSTAKAYGFDQMFNATPVELHGSDGQTHTYASFPDKSSGSQALQSYLTSVIAGNQTAGEGQMDPKIANSGLGTTSDKWQANAILTGTQPPPNPTTGSISKSKGNVLAILAKAGYDVTKGWLDFKATEKFVISSNSPQQVRMRQAEQSVEQSLPALQAKVDKLSQDGAMSGFKFVNKASLNAAVNGLYGSAVAQDAQAVVGQLALVTDELGQTFMGGNSPTDSAFDLAKGVLSSDFTAEQFKTQIDLIKENLQYRKNSWSSAGIVGADGQIVSPGGGAGAGDQSNQDLLNSIPGL